MLLLSFDIEEFDVPCEHGVAYDPVGQGMAISVPGTVRILDLLAECGVRATFFCTVTFAQHAPEVLRRIVREGHEVASHGVSHLHPQPDDIRRSRQQLMELSGQDVWGYRQPRLLHVPEGAVQAAGYAYDSSLNPTFIPGRYAHLRTPRTWFMQGSVMQVPASVTPWLRLPLFWLSLHHLPQCVYHALVRRTLRHDGYVATYFHPWEFVALGEHPELRVPRLIRRRCGQPMYDRLRRFIRTMQAEGQTFGTFRDFVEARRP